jgi:hypothetical protein
MSHCTYLRIYIRLNRRVLLLGGVRAMCFRRRIEASPRTIQICIDSMELQMMGVKIQ